MIKWLFLFSFFAFSFSNPSVISLKAVEKVNLKFAEPSDVSYFNHQYFFACDNGCLKITNDSFKVTKTIKFEGADLEGVFADGAHIYLSDESGRQIITLNASDFSVVSKVSVAYNGARNFGMESICTDGKGNFYSAAEKEPVLLMRWTGNFSVSDNRELANYSDISGMTFHDGVLWILSDEDHSITKVNATDYSVIDKWDIPVYNPEGICFNDKGQLVICSDRMSKLFIFNITP